VDVKVQVGSVGTDRVDTKAREGVRKGEENLGFVVGSM
jgi:hypothetical protein